MGKNGLIRKWDLMYEQFGRAEGKCKDCSHFKHRVGGYSKCLIYGDTASEASDWKVSADACGLFNQETKHENVIRLVRGVRKDAPIEGQMSFGDYDDAGVLNQFDNMTGSMNL